MLPPWPGVTAGLSDALNYCEMLEDLRHTAR